MNLLVNILIDGVAYAMVLFMITIGLSLTLGLMHVVNMAHGVFAMIAGLLTAHLVTAWGVNFVLATLMAIACSALVAVPVERLLIRRFYKRSPMDQMLMTMGIVFVASAAASAIFGPQVVNVPLPEWLAGSVEIGHRQFPAHRLMVIVVGLVSNLCSTPSVAQNAIRVTDNTSSLISEAFMDPSAASDLRMPSRPPGTCATSGGIMRVMTK